MSVTYVPIYGLLFKMLTRFHTLYFGASCIHRNSIVWRRVILARFPYLLEKRKWRISRYSYLLETLISIEYGLRISCHVTVFRLWPLEKNTDYIIIGVKILYVGKLSPQYFYTPVFRHDVLWYGDVRPSVRPSGSPSARFPHFSHICFDILRWNFAHDFVLMY